VGNWPRALSIAPTRDNLVEIATTDLGQGEGGKKGTPLGSR